MGYVIRAFALSLFLRQQASMIFVVPKHEDLVMLKDLIEAKKVTPVIDRTYTLSETAEAFRYMDEGHAQGKVVIRVCE